MLTIVDPKGFDAVASDTCIANAEVAPVPPMRRDAIPLRCCLNAAVTAGFGLWRGGAISSREHGSAKSQEATNMDAYHVDAVRDEEAEV